MTRINSLLVATTLAILPIAAFAQTSTAPTKDVAPTAQATGGTTTAPSTTANVIQPATPPVKTTASATKTDTHGVSKVNPNHAKAAVPAKTAAPAKS